MSKLMRSRHVALALKEPKAIEEEFEDFVLSSKEAGVNLHSFREIQGWTRNELGEKVGLDAEHIGLMESGEQPIPVLMAKRFAEIFKTDHQTFL